MKAICISLRLTLLPLAMLGLLLGGLVRAQDGVPEPAGAAWQQVVSAQIEAFRRGDAAGALALAGEGFRSAYDDPVRFYDDIARGYRPILESISHSFGDFSLADDVLVLQVVRLVGPDQGLYEALYQLALEPDGWRVQAVALRAREGMGV